MGALLALVRNRLSARFVILTLILLIIIQAAGFIVVRATVDKHVRDEVYNSIKVSERIWDKILLQTHQPLQEGSEVLASDFGFRSAVASRDEKTIASALENSAKRIHASVAFLVDARWQLQATSMSLTTGSDLDVLIQHLSESASDQSQQEPLIALYKGIPTQFVFAPIRAPRIVGYVVMGFAIEQDLINEASELAGIEMALLTIQNESLTSLISSNAGIADYFKYSLNSLPLMNTSVLDFEIGGEIYVSSISSKTVIGGQVHNVFMKSLSEASKRFTALEQQYSYITFFGLIIFALVITWLSRRVTHPLVELTSATSALEKGDFDVQVRGGQRTDEIGVLARSFDGMRLSIKEQQHTITQLAYHDSLTGLPNRLSFRRLVAQKMASGEFESVSVITINLDRFKQVNDVLGYEMGDQILKATASRLLGVSCSEHDKLARVSGDEFSVLVLSTPDDALEIAKSLLDKLIEPLEIDETQIDLNASIGIASWPEDASSCDALINASQVAMYAAKQRTEDIAIFKQELVTSTPDNLSLLSELRQAVRNDELRVYLQPKVDTQNHRVVAAEALVRWQHPEKGLVPPYRFVPFAEQTGFVRELTKWVIRSVARDWHALQPLDGMLRISVNLSTRDLTAPYFTAFLQQMLDEYQVPAAGLCLEITESAIMDDPAVAEQTLAKLSAMGFRLSIDDFGTGYSSLGYLKRLPVNELKVDQSFVFGMIDNANDCMIVQSTIDLAHNLGLSVVAEGVETEAMYQRLSELGCEEAQGYFIAKPMPLDEFEVWRKQWLESHNL